jgi:ATP-binding cassette, subfamily B, bacterial
MRKFPFYQQIDMRDCGPTCLRMISKHYGKVYSREFLRSKSHITKEGVSLAGIAEAAEGIGFQSLGLSVDMDMLINEIPLPCIVPWRQRHFIVVYKTNNKKVFVADPAFGLIEYTLEEFKSGWFNKKQVDTNYVLALEPSPSFYVQEDDEKNKNSYFGFVFPYFRPYKSIIFQIFLGLLVGTFIQFVLPFLMQTIVDYGVNFKDISFIYLILIAQLTLFVSNISVRIFRDWLILHLTSRMGIRMASDFLIKLLKLPLYFFETRSTGEHMQRIQDHQRVQEFLSSTSLNSFFSIFTLIAFGTVLAFYNLNIFFIFLVGATLFVSWTFFFLKKRALLDFKRFDQMADNQSSLIEIIDGINEIKVNNSHRKKRWMWEGIQIRLFKLSIKSLTLAQLQNIGANVINEVKNIIITFISAKAVIDGEMSLGMMISVQYIIGQLNVPLNSFVSLIQSGQDAKISLERLSQVHNLDDENLSATNTDLIGIDSDIVLENLSFRYGGESSPFVLKDIDLVLPAGKTTAIVGASGSGKTTLLKLLLKFHNPTIGSIKVNNVVLKEINSDIWRAKCGAVMQEGYIFNDTVAGNIAESEQTETIDKNKIVESVYIANIEEYINDLPNGYNTLIGRRGISLSGGQRQRLFIARAVYKNPYFLLFDEATSALDANNEKVVMERLNQYLESKTAVIIAHRLSTVKNADNIVVLEKGRIVEQGTHKQLTEKRGIYFELVKNQLELGN